MNVVLLYARKLRWYNIDIAALSETHSAGESNLEEIGAGYTFFWSGVPEGEKHQAGVGFAIKTSTLCQFEFLPKGEFLPKRNTKLVWVLLLKPVLYASLNFFQKE